MRGVNPTSIRATLRLVVSATLVSVLFVAHAAAQQQPTTTEKDVNAATEVADSPEETEFKNMLVKNSPWGVEWTNRNGRTGSHKLRFTTDGAALSGVYFDSSTGSQESALENIKVMETCATFKIRGLTGWRNYKYCKEKNGALKIKGPYDGVSDRGGSYDGEAMATPVNR